MTYELEISKHSDRIFKKLAKRDRRKLEIIHNKINEILENPHHFKPLRGDMHGSMRVHIDSSFVLIYDIDDKAKIVRILDFGHHDDVY